MHTVRTSPYDWRPHSFYALWCSNINILINIEFCYLSVNRFLCHLFICRFLDLWFCFEICAIYWAYKTANGWLLWNPQPDISVLIYYFLSPPMDRTLSPIFFRLQLDTRWRWRWVRQGPSQCPCRCCRRPFLWARAEPSAPGYGWALPQWVICCWSLLSSCAAATVVGAEAGFSGSLPPCRRPQRTLQPQLSWFIARSLGAIWFCFGGFQIGML